MDHLPTMLPLIAPAADEWAGMGSAAALALAGGLLLYAASLWLATHRPGWLPALAYRHFTLRRSLILGLGLVAVVPVLTLGLVLADRTAEQRQQRLAYRLYETSAFAARSGDQFLDKYRTAVESLAKSLEGSPRLDAALLSERLLTYHGLYESFLTMLAADRDGRVLTATSIVDGSPQVVTSFGVDISDRAYLREPLRTGKPYISEVFRGRGLGNDPIVAVSAPLRGSDGEWWGIVEGSLDLSAFSWFEENAGILDGADILIVDANGRVIYGGARADYDSLESMQGTALHAAWQQAEGAVFSYREGAQPYRTGGYYLVAVAALGNGWQVLSRVPLATVRDQVLADYRVSVGWMLAALLVSLLVALAISRRLSQPLEKLSRAVDDFHPETGHGTIAIPPQTPAEVASVYRHLNSQGERLERYYTELLTALHEGERLQVELKDVIGRREDEIASRTRELQAANAALEQLTRVDSLTGLANRRWFAEFLEQAWRVGLREQVAVALIIIDIDYFKAYNDTYGHQAGDECLTRVAAAIRGAVGRPLDLVARYGGEEFVMVLADTPLENALLVAERTRAAVEELAMPHRASETATVVTISVGVSATVPGPASRPATYMTLADQALYEAKNEGRNRVAYATEQRSGVYQPARGRALERTGHDNAG